MGCCGSVEENTKFRNCLSNGCEMRSLIEPPPPTASAIAKYYHFGTRLGSGSFSQVIQGTHKVTGQEVAIKFISRGNLTTGEDLAVSEEVAILQVLDHPSIIKLIDYKIDEHYHYIVLERMSGGELFRRIAKKARYTECEAKRICKSILEGIAYLHTKGVVHRDIKPENLLLVYDHDDSPVKIADFGLAVWKADRLRASVGSPFYVAPEIIKGHLYCEKVDIWSFGVIVYIMLCGYPPFYSPSGDELFDLIRTGKFSLDAPPWHTISKKAKDAIKQMLQVDPEKRPSAETLLTDPWFIPCAEAVIPLPTTITNLHSFQSRRRFKAIVNEVIAVSLFSSAIHPSFYHYEILESPTNEKESSEHVPFSEDSTLVPAC